ncbi:UNVERIFIED_CONTAM: Receptor-like protein 2 [Sesamum angustifolium]|uniref:Receptor-like protein 2 n=1 Tax=Sesamum angustifolium TaxID=2727405 RepID=A0AAW2QPS7_9LAMI
MDCTNLKTLLLRNNLFGELSSLDFSKLQKLQTIDLGNNSLWEGFRIACACACAVSDNYLSNILGALKILRNCDNVAVLFMSRCFHERLMESNWLPKSANPNSGRMQSHRPNPFLDCKTEEKQILESLLQQNLRTNPHLIRRYAAPVCRQPYPKLPVWRPSTRTCQEYNRLFNMLRGLNVGTNSLSGNIPEELGQLKLLQALDVSNNNFNGSIPDELSRLHFLSSFSVANNDLEGEIPSGGQFDTFSAVSFEGNPKLCGDVLKRNVLPSNKLRSWFKVAVSAIISAGAVPHRSRRIGILSGDTK